MTSKYRSWVCALAVLVTACTPQDAAPSPLPSGSATVPSTPSVTPGLGAAIATESVGPRRQWYLIPDGFVPSAPSVDDDGTAQILIRFAGDPRPGRPVARFSPDGREVPLVAIGTGPNLYAASLPLAGAQPGMHSAEIVEHLASGRETSVGRTEFMVTWPEYVVWTLDFEGDASGDAELANTAAIADGLKVPMSVLWNPRVWTTSQVSAERQDAMLAWTKDRIAKGDEVGLHLHMWTDYVRAAGLVPRTAPSWAGRGDGYDVPITAYPENEQQALIGYGVKLMLQHGLPTPTSFRAGGDFADAATLRAVAASGFNADCTAVAKDYPPIGRIPYPWTLPAGAQPYRPSSTDANAAGDLALLEAPTIGGNTFGFTTQTIQPQMRANLALFAPVGTVAPERKAITVVSHPGTIVAAERAAIEALLGAFDALRYDRDSGPVRFVTLAQLAKAYAR